MKGDPKVIDYLNKGLRSELTAINQYWLHFRILDNWGLKKLAQQWRKESIEEMQHADRFTDRILFLETSEDKPTVDQVKYWLFNYGVQGVFTQLSALLIGRARGYTDDEKAELDDMILGVVADEFGARDLTIVTNMDFGHTDPQWILPLGVQASVDCAARSFVLLESPCQ